MNEIHQPIPLVIESASGAGRSAIVRDCATAERIRAAVARHFVDALGVECLFEVTLANKRRADILALAPSGELWIVEVKSSHADYRSDNKWTDYLDYCDRFWFATDERFDPTLLDDATNDARVGHWITDGYELFERSDSSADKLSGARRKAVLQRFAALAARRLYHLTAPD